MKYAADFRQEARESLKGNWLNAVIAGLLASILGAGASVGGFNFNFNFSDSGSDGGTLSEVVNSDIMGVIIGVLSTVFIVALIIGAGFFVLGSIIDLGYAQFNLDLVDKKPISINTLFAYFPRWKTAIASRFLQAIYVFLWSLLFIVPGIIAIYRYSMTRYIIAEDENITANDAITKSKEMMIGNKGRLFCLEFSFIGWSILAAFTCVIGYLWLIPYMQASYAAFYREVSGTGALNAAQADGVVFENPEDGPTAVIYSPEPPSDPEN